MCLYVSVAECACVYLNSFLKIRANNDDDTAAVVAAAASAFAASAHISSRKYAIAVAFCVRLFSSSLRR